MYTMYTTLASAFPRDLVRITFNLNCCKLDLWNVTGRCQGHSSVSTQAPASQKMRISKWEQDLTSGCIEGFLGQASGNELRKAFSNWTSCPQSGMLLYLLGDVDSGAIGCCTWPQVERLFSYPRFVSNHKNNIWEHCWIFVSCCGMVSGCDHSIGIFRQFPLVTPLTARNIVMSITFMGSEEPKRIDLLIGFNY
jgi:hypothetical protein